MKVGLTEIIVILDRSGSMGSRWDETIMGFNIFVSEQQRANLGEARLSLIQFDDKYEPNYTGVDIHKVQPLSATTYVPRGSTALVDAIGRTIIEAGQRFAAMPEEERPEKVLVQIITDGFENASMKFTKPQVKEMIQHQESKYFWLFTFMGTTFDAVGEAAAYGIGAGQTMSFGSGTYGAAGMFKGMSVNTMRVRSAPDAASAKAYGTYTMSEKDEAAQEDSEVLQKDKDQWEKEKVRAESEPEKDPTTA